MSLINIISAIGNNSSIYPLIVRDCGIEVPTKTALTYMQNLKDSKDMANNALRERLIDEYGTSLVWLGGIPLVDWLCDRGIKKLGYNPDINPKLFKETSSQGIELNIRKFKNSSPELVKDLEKVLKSKKVYERLLAGKFVLSTAIPISLMGFFLPKANFKLTQVLRDKKQTENKSCNNISFKGAASVLSNMSTVNKMAVTDGGLTVGRVTTARNKYEKMEMGFKMTGMMFLNFVAPIWIAKLFDSISNKVFKTNVNLDPKILNDKVFLETVKNSNLELPNKDVIEFLDKNPNSLFSKFANKFVGRGKYFINGKRNPVMYIDEKKLTALKSEIESFAKQAKDSGNIEKFAKKALMVKSFNIIANVLLSSFLLAFALPKVTFWLRKVITGSDAEPGLVQKV